MGVDDYPGQTKAETPQAPTGFSGPLPAVPIPGTKASGSSEPPISSSPSSPGASVSGNYDRTKGLLPYNFVIELYNPNSGQVDSWYYGDLVAAGDMAPGLYYGSYLNNLPDWSIPPAGGGGGGGRGGGGGAVGPVYVKPDERMVRESVKGMLASLAGTVDQGKLDSLTKMYMDEHKRSFAVRESEQVDPMESVKASIRDTSEYKTIHKLRPESTDEYDWITSRQGALTRAGVTARTAETLGIAQATVGASTQQAVTAGNVSSFNQSGQQLDELKNRIRTAAYGALRLA